MKVKACYMLVICIRGNTAGVWACEYSADGSDWNTGEGL